MEFIKELFALTEAKKKDLHRGGMMPIASFVGNTVLSKDTTHGEDEDEEVVAEKSNTMKVELPKARNKQVNDVLRAKKGGRMFDEKKDFSRAKEKAKASRGFFESEMKQWDYEVEYEVKDRSGERGDYSKTTYDDGIVSATSAAEAKEKIKAKHRHHLVVDCKVTLHDPAKSRNDD